MQEKNSAEPKSFGPLLLDIGIGLLRAGASSNRIGIILRRMAAAYQCKTHIDISPKSISLSLHAENEQVVFNGTRSTPDYGVNFKMISGISRMSWAVTENPWPLQEIKNEMDRLKSLPHYPRLIVLAVVALAGASFCYTFGGDAFEMSITFGATFCGLFVKQELVKKSFNTYICTFISALVAALFTGAFYKAGLGLQLEHAYATCVLFLIPGVPLINFFIDLIAGNILYGLDRGVNALMHAMAIAFGLAAAVFIYNFHT